MRIADYCCDLCLDTLAWDIALYRTIHTLSNSRGPALYALQDNLQRAIFRNIRYAKADGDMEAGKVYR